MGDVALERKPNADATIAVYIAQCFVLRVPTFCIRVKSSPPNARPSNSLMCIFSLKVA